MPNKTIQEIIEEYRDWSIFTMGSGATPREQADWWLSKFSAENRLFGKCSSYKEQKGENRECSKKNKMKPSERITKIADRLIKNGTKGDVSLFTAIQQYLDEEWLKGTLETIKKIK